MNENLSLLIRLQECDSVLAELFVKKDRLPEKLSQMDGEFQRFKESISQNATSYESLKTKREESELKAKKISETMARSKEKLLDVKTNKEYQAMLKEIEAAETSLSDLESNIILLMDEMDQLLVEVKQDQEKLKQAQIRHLEDKKIIEDRLNSLDEEVAKLNQKRLDLQKDIPQELLVLYEKIKKRNHGLGVIPVWKAVCSGCHMNIPPQLYNELQRSNDLLSCPSCHRIMYFQNQDTATQDHE